MSQSLRGVLYFAGMALLLIGVGIGQSWSVSLTLLNLCLISAIMALGVNIQWGYAGLFNVGVMGFAALGGLAGVLVSQAPVTEAWAAGGSGLFFALLSLAATVLAMLFVYRHMPRGRTRALVLAALAVAGFFLIRVSYDPAVDAIEAIEPAKTGYLGGVGMPIIFSWIVGGLFAAAAAWCVGKITLGLRSDYLAIATLGISEIIIAVLKNEDWLSRGVKNVTGLSRPVPYEVDLQNSRSTS